MAIMQVDQNQKSEQTKLITETDPFNMDVRSFQASANNAVDPATTIAITVVTISVTKYVVTIAAAC